MNTLRTRSHPRFQAQHSPRSSNRRKPWGPVQRPGLPSAACAFLLALCLIVPGLVTQPAWAVEDGSQDPALQQTVDPDERTVTDEKVVRDSGHLDIGPRMSEDQWSLQVRDDTQVPAVWRHLDDVVFRVGADAELELPEGEEYGFTGAQAGQPVWAVPQVEIPGVVWLGWNTQDPLMTQRVDGGVNLRLKDVQGPGDFSVFLQPGNFEPPQVLWDGQKDEDQEIWVDLHTHTHANWVFTEPGVYLVAIEAAAEDHDGNVLTDTATLRFSVGEDTDTEAAATAAWEPGRGPESEPGSSAQAQGDAEESEVPVGLMVSIAAIVAVLVVIVGAVTLRARRGARNTRDQVWRDAEGGDR